MKHTKPAPKTLMLLLMCLISTACQPTPATLMPSSSPSGSPTFSQRETSPTVSPVFTPTDIPTDWLEFRNDTLNISLRYPSNWQINGGQRAHGGDGFWSLETRPYAPSLYDQISPICVQEANQPQNQTRYGTLPLIYDWQNGSSSGCIVAPKQPQPGLEAVLFARNSTQPDNLLVLRADSAHFDEIRASLRFLASPPETDWSGSYDSPACREAPAAPAISTQQAGAFLITEYAIANHTCHPLRHLDGFRARVNALPVNLHQWLQDDLRKRAQLANRHLSAFGLHLEENRTTGNTITFDLKTETHTLFPNLITPGEISIRSDKQDFLFWARAQDSNGSQFPLLVYRTGLDALSVWEQGFDIVWAGSQQISFKYSETELFPIGAPAQILVFAEGQPLTAIAIPPMGAAGSPVRGLWNWDTHWVIEIRSTLFVDGTIKNTDWGYDEIFDWHLVNGKPLFAARRSTDFTLVYDGQQLPITYDDIAHGDVCCDAGQYDFQPLADGALFYARQGSVWFLVRVQINTAQSFTSPQFTLDE